MSNAKLLITLLAIVLAIKYFDAAEETAPLAATDSVTLAEAKTSSDAGTKAWTRGPSAPVVQTNQATTRGLLPWR